MSKPDAPLPPTRIEVCVQDAAGCRAAESGGADRIELCSALSEGGLTPTMGLWQRAKAASRLEIVALLRPRRGDFVYDADEKAVQLEDLVRLREAGARCFAVGALLPDGLLDLDFLSELRAAAGPATLTCHRAFDHTAKPLEALEQLIKIGFERVLSSGQEANAPQGAALLGSMVAQAAGRIEVVAAAGIRPQNVAALVRRSAVPSVHLSASRNWRRPMGFSKIRAVMGEGTVSDEFVRRVTDESVVRSCRLALN